MAIREALRWLSTRTDLSAYVTIHSDSQSAIATLRNPNTRNPIAREALAIAASLNITVYVTWVRGHSGVDGNELADELAREAAISSLPVFYNQIPLLSIRTSLHQHFLTLWNERWMTSSTGSLTREFFPTVSSRMRAQHVNVHSFTSTQLLTGHANLSHYHHRFGRRDSDLCICASGKSETVHHYIFECDRYAVQRRELEAACSSSGVCFPCSLSELTRHRDLWTVTNEFISSSQRLNLPRIRAAAASQVPSIRHSPSNVSIN